MAFFRLVYLVVACLQVRLGARLPPPESKDPLPDSGGKGFLTLDGDPKTEKPFPPTISRQHSPPHFPTKKTASAAGDWNGAVHPIYQVHGLLL